LINALLPENLLGDRISWRASSMDRRRAGTGRVLAALKAWLPQVLKTRLPWDLRTFCQRPSLLAAKACRLERLFTFRRFDQRILITAALGRSLLVHNIWPI